MCTRVFNWFFPQHFLNMALFVQKRVKQFDSQLLNYLATGKNEKALIMLKNLDPRYLFDTSRNYTLLHWTVHNSQLDGGNAFMIKYFVDKGCNVDAKDRNGNTPLFLAVNKGKQTHAVRALIDANANIHMPNKKGCTPLRFVIDKSTLFDRDVVKLFLNRLRVECCDDKQLLVNKLMKHKCPVYFAVLLGDAEITGMMLDRGCSIEARCQKTGDTALHAAVAQSDLANVKVLVERGANVNSENYHKMQPLYRYNIDSEDTNERLEMLKFLIAQGAMLTISSPSITAVARMMCFAGKETISTLLQYGGKDLREKNIAGTSMIHCVCVNKRPGIEEAIRLFRGKDFDIDAAEYHGVTALMVAALNKNLNIVECLLEIGANPNAETHGRCNLLFMIYQNPYALNLHPAETFRRIVDLLLLYGADFQNSTYGTFLKSYNAHSDDPYMAKSLIARLAEMELQDKSLVTESTRYNLRKVERYQKYFEFCQKSLADMKTIKAHETITLLLPHRGSFVFVKKKVFLKS